MSKYIYNNLSIDYTDPKAVKSLNTALLQLHYNIKNWAIPKKNLCPSIPGRVDYIHYIADLLSDNDPPRGTNIKGLDIGTGASCIYPLLGHSSYGWKFVGTDIDSDSINNCKAILNSNPKHKKNIKLRYQESKDDFFKGIIKPEESFDFTMCNPPFFSSQDEARSARDRKIKNLTANRNKKGHIYKKTTRSNFKGNSNELWTEGGELSFITKMIHQSIDFEDQCTWFTSLVSKQENIPALRQILESYNRFDIEIIKMEQGNKIAHILAWSKK